MAGAGTLPGRAAAEARRRGWRVVAFAFEDAPGLAEAADAFLPSSITDIQAVLVGLAAQRVEAAVFVGKFWKSSAFSQYDRADDAGRDLAQGGLSDAALSQMVVATLAGMRIEVLDQREFLSPWLLPAGVLGRCSAVDVRCAGHLGSPVWGGPGESVAPGPRTGG